MKLKKILEAIEKSAYKKKEFHTLKLWFETDKREGGGEWLKENE